jgi:hypothetical protein
MTLSVGHFYYWISIQAICKLGRPEAELTLHLVNSTVALYRLSVSWGDLKQS